MVPIGFSFLSLGRNEILASLCPQVFGLYLVKLAVAMVLAGGVQRTDAAGTRVRGQYIKPLLLSYVANALILTAIRIKSGACFRFFYNML